MKTGVFAKGFGLLMDHVVKKKDGFGMNELLGIAAALILAAFIIIPGLRDFADGVITKLTGWWTGSVVDTVFPAS